MQNFEFHIPTRLIFGKGVIQRLPEVMSQYGRRVLLAYGGGSIKRSGLYDEIRRLLADFEIYELPGIAPNPKYDPSVLEGVRLCKEHQIDVLLAVGGGSVIDCCKAIAAGACYAGETWDLIIYKAKVEAALPIVDILTIAATGSEFDSGGVISRTETNDKTELLDPHLFPACSFMDPTYTFTVPWKQTAAGIADAMNHIMEQYFCGDSTILNDGFMEAGLRSLMINGRKCLENPEDYTARAEMMQACSYGCNGLYSLGSSYTRWPCHKIEHALSAYYDITHGVGLAIITPHWMRAVLNAQTLPRFVQYATRVFEIPPAADPYETAKKGIEATYDFFASIGLPMHLRDVGIDERRIPEMAHHIAVNERLDLAYAPLNEDEIADILRTSL